MDFTLRKEDDSMQRQIIDKIEQFDTIIIHRHVRPDPDAYGSQMGLQKLIQHNYPTKKVYAVGEHESSLDFLGTPDVIADGVYEGALVIVTDTANTERVDDTRYTKGAALIKIDHHPNDDVYGDIVWVDTTASSVSELIFDFFELGQQEKGWTLPTASARLLYAGIVGDTGRFRYPSATLKTFTAAGKLITYDFDREALYNGMYELERKVLQLQGYIYQNFTMDENGTGRMDITRDVLEQFNTTASEASLLVSSLGNVKDMKAWVMFIEEADSIRIRLRSKGPVINGLAKEFGGGGHPLASGASAANWDEANASYQRLQEICK